MTAQRKKEKKKKTAQTVHEKKEEKPREKSGHPAPIQLSPCHKTPTGFEREWMYFHPSGTLGKGE